MSRSTPGVVGAGIKSYGKMAFKFRQKFASTAATWLTSCCCTFGSYNALHRATPGAKDWKRRKALKAEVLEEDVGHFRTEQLRVRGLQSGAKASVCCLAPWCVLMRFGNPGASGGKLVENAGL